MAVRFLLWISLLLYLLPSAFAANAAFKKNAEGEVTCGELKESYYLVSMRDRTPRQRRPSVCDQSNPEKSHNASNLVDGKYSTWWQSTAALNRANITIDLEGPNRKFYFVDEIVIKFGEYYRPKRMSFWKSSDFGVTYEPWHYYVTPGNNPTVGQQCEDYFGVPADSTPNSADDILCTEYPEEVALDRNQNVALSFDAAFRGSSINNPSQQFLDFINVTNVRIEFYTLERIFDLLAVKWHHYAVREVEVSAYCDCNGQGDGLKCKYNETIKDNECTCQDGACGFNCEMCCPAYNQFPWKQGQRGPLVADPDTACQPCNCHSHSSVCIYNETVAKLNMSMDMNGSYVGGGVCQDCKDNTQGINCEKCETFFFHPKGKSQEDKDACHECNCSIAGTKNITLPGVLYLDCIRDEDTKAPRPDMGPGDCICKNNSNGRRCDLCKPGFFNLSSENPGGCQECTCNTNGTVNASNVCTPDAFGQCPCKKYVEGLLCTTCVDTFYDLQDSDKDGCKACDCDVGGSEDPICNKTSGQCTCHPNVTSRRCKRPEDKFYYPSLHFMSGSEGITKHGENNTSWVTKFNVTQGVNTSGLFILLLTYSSKSTVSVTVTVTSAGANTEQQFTLDSCSPACSRNLTAFGEIPLSGKVTVNLTFPSASHFKPQRVVALPREFYHPTLLGNATMADFLANCSIIENDMKNNSEMCLAHVFSITVGYLGRALACDCDPVGSVNLTCQKAGGQCYCKPGVTGRQCDCCQAEFYNFTVSGCSACDCKGDHKVCDVKTGQCECPDNTVGRMCDQCNHTYWGWNSTYGCQACNCNVTGSSDLQCNLTTGVCSCKDGVMGDKCTACRDEYKNFSNAGCSSCDCDVSGSLNPVCEKHSGQCPCKNNTAGLTCDQCSFGFFYLTQSNAEGCTSCTCMGITKNCSSTARVSYEKDVDLSYWNLESHGGDTRVPVSPVTIQDVDMISANISANQTLYWKANKNFTQQSMVGAYGGKISFKLHISKLNGSFVPEAKVLLKGVKNITIEHGFPVISPDDVVKQEIDMKESSWVYADGHRTVSREDFMLVLAKLKAFLITASFYKSGETLYQTSFGNITMNMTREIPPTVDVAYDVEQCECGSGYTGLSCERCARGHHRVNVSSDPFLGKCVPCNCHGHSGDCDPDTGECLGCEHNSTGFYCELCMDGFYGDATNGTPHDCKTCPCEAPRTNTSLCKADINGRPQCLNCSTGYEGDICERCELGYFGTPLSPGGMCSLCQCNNNSDVCNTTSGECIDCKHNSTGFNCERCENGTWGNATIQQCQDCTCHGVGARHNVCNHVTGQCVCKPHVNGMNCSRCEANSYNFTENGCTECHCNKFGSNNLQCNESGVCECRNHTLGQKCDLCEWGFFGLPYKTCEGCDCNTTGSLNYTQCNRTSGQCNCKPGVTARRCDQCMLQHTNFSASGCDACPKCTRMGLQEDINKANKIMEKATDDANTVSNLKELWDPLKNLEERIDNAQESYQEFDILVTSLSSNITHLMAKAPNETIMELQEMLTHLSSQTDGLKVEMSRELQRVQTIHDNTTTTKLLVNELDKTVKLVIQDLSELKDMADKMKDQATTFLNEDYVSELSFSKSELAKAFDVHATALMALYNVTSQRNTTKQLNASVVRSEGDLQAVEGDFGGIIGRVDAVTNYTVHVLVLLNHTKILIGDGNETISRAREVLQTIAGILTASEKHVSKGQTALENTTSVLEDDPGLKSEMGRLEAKLADTPQFLDTANQTVKSKGTERAANLTAEARKRQKLYNRTLSHGGKAVAAIKKYEEVVKLMEESLESSSKANQTIHQAMQRLENITNVKSDLAARASVDLDQSGKLLQTTLERDVNLKGLKANVSHANQTFWRAVMIGKQVDEQYGVLLTTRDSLLQAAEVAGQKHPIKQGRIDTDYWAAEAVNQINQIDPKPKMLNESDAAPAYERIEEVDNKTVFINMAAEESRRLMAEAIDFTQNASRNVSAVKDKVDRADSLKKEIKILQSNLKRNVTALKEKLEKIKEYASQIRLALSVKGSTSVQYRPPSQTIDTPRSFNEISMDFKPTRAQGTLFFMSGEESTSLSLSISSEAYLEFKYNLSNFQNSITNWEIRIRPGNWYRAYATRYDKGGRLTVMDFAANRSRTYDYEDEKRVYDTTEMKFTNNSLLYLGGLPGNSDVGDPNGHFHGCIDNVLIDQEDLNLWDPIRVEGNRSFCTRRPPLARDELYSVVQGASFYGTGYIEQRMGSFNIANQSEMVFQFRTFQDIGLLASVSQEQEHIYGVYLNMSRVVFFLKASGQMHKVYSQQASYSDGRWYQVRVVRRLENVTLTVVPVGAQGLADVSTVSLNSSVLLSSGGSLFFGGVDQSSPASCPLSTSFAGCIRNVNVSAPTSETLISRLLDNKNLTVNEPEGVDFDGCLKDVEEGIRFLGDGYAALNNTELVFSSLKIKFKTLQPSGLLFYSGEDRLVYLALFHGNLFLVSTNSTEMAATTESETLNDGAYHTVEITYSPTKLQMRLAEGGDTKTLTIPGPIPLSRTLYVGGLEPNMTIPLAAPITRSFVGDMKEVVVNGKSQHIFSGTSHRVSLAGVPPPWIVVPTLQPTERPAPPKCGDSFPPLENSVDGEVNFDTPGSYVGFDPTEEVLGYIKRMGVISVRFRALSPNGVLLYTTNDVHNPVDFLSLELVNGRLVFKYNAGGGLVRLQSVFSNYSSGGHWWTVRLLRIDQFGAMLVPESKDYDRDRVGNSKLPLDIKSPIYYGGVPKNINTTFLETGGLTFLGCLGNLTIQSANKTKLLSPRNDSDPTMSSFNKKPCYKNVQSQAGFDGTGQLLLSEKLHTNFDMALKFRTTSRTGLLMVLTNSSGSSSLILEKIEGQVALTFNGKQNSTVVWTDPYLPEGSDRNSSFRLCDNNFHEVLLHKKGRDVTLSVDGHNVTSKALQADFTLDGKFYVGGVPDNLGVQGYGGMSRVRLTGCVESLRIGDKYIDLLRSENMDNVQRGCRAPRRKT